MTANHLSTRRRFLKSIAVAAPAFATQLWIADKQCRAQPAAHSQPYKIGIYTRPWAQFDYRQALDAIADAGYHYVGLMTTTHTPPNKDRLVLSASTSTDEAKRIAHEISQRGLRVSSVYGGGIPVQKSLAAGVDGLRKLIDNCAVVSAQSLLMGGIGDERLFNTYYDAIAKCCDYAAERRLPITVKPHGGLNSTGPQCRRCIDRVNHPNFSLWYDPGNIFYYSNGALDPVDDAPRVAELVKVGMCIKDFQMTPRNGVPTRDVAITPGTGRVDFAKVLAALRDGALRKGHLVIECLQTGDGQLATIKREAIRARNFCERLVSPYKTS